MIIDYVYGAYAQLPTYQGSVQNYSHSRSAVWVYNPVTGQVCVTVNAPGTYCYTVGPIGGGGSRFVRLTDSMVSKI